MRPAVGHAAVPAAAVPEAAIDEDGEAGAPEDEIGAAREGPVATPAGPSGYHLVAILHFENLAAIQGAFGSAEGQAAVADVQTFATGGVDIFMFDTRQV